MHVLASTCGSQHKYDEAEELFQQALISRRESLGARHPDTLETMHDLASTYTFQGKYNEAKELFQKILTGDIEALGAMHQLTMYTVRNLAIVYRRLGQHKEATELERKFPSTENETNGSLPRLFPPLPQVRSPLRQGRPQNLSHPTPGAFLSSKADAPTTKAMRLLQYIDRPHLTRRRKSRLPEHDAESRCYLGPPHQAGLRLHIPVIAGLQREFDAFFG